MRSYAGGCLPVSLTPFDRLWVSGQVEAVDGQPVEPRRARVRGHPSPPSPSGFLLRGRNDSGLLAPLASFDRLRTNGKGTPSTGSGRTEEWPQRALRGRPPPRFQRGPYPGLPSGSASAVQPVCSGGLDGSTSVCLSRPMNASLMRRQDKARRDSSVEVGATPPYRWRT